QVGVVAFERVDLPAMGGTRRTQLFAQLICRRTEPFVGVGLLGRTRRRRGAFGLDGIQRGIERVLPALATGEVGDRRDLGRIDGRHRVGRDRLDEVFVSGAYECGDAV